MSDRPHRAVLMRCRETGRNTQQGRFITARHEWNANKGAPEDVPKLPDLSIEGTTWAARDAVQKRRDERQAEALRIRAGDR